PVRAAPPARRRELRGERRAAVARLVDEDPADVALVVRPDAVHQPRIERVDPLDPRVARRAALDLVREPRDVLVLPGRGLVVQEDPHPRLAEVTDPALGHGPRPHRRRHAGPEIEAQVELVRVLQERDRKSTRLNSSHVKTSYA